MGGWGQCGLFSLHCDFSLVGPSGAVSHKDKASQGIMTGTQQLLEGLVHYLRVKT